ncbi:hypothetical protein [Colwellia sp. Bg11-28]|uniref:hypothetical protein n=1 Tax=Colwellia sp. Bg11-28 TaxID=2058305 RepID=UPI000C331291|nr:hypothetical protein [Colwellia sp. Bg11-28]PKH87678.1 hypothetical protein CXF79_13650 [Colwellia sp. Bg11-28]
MINNNNKLIISSVFALSLTACGGGGSDTPEVLLTPDTVEKPVPVPVPIAEPAPLPSETTIRSSGKVIDGYVVGATVWLDFDGDGKYDQQTEPSTVSGESGDYSFEFSEDQAACVPYSTTYVDVPVGAMDLDLGEVTEAYQMSFPPSIEAISDNDIRNISPLTTVIWGQLKRQLKASGKGNLTCDQLKQDSALRNEIKNEVENVMLNLVQHYNLSEEQIYSDFIASKDSETYDHAQSIVKGLKAAYKHKKKLEKIYPDAAEIRVTVYQDAVRDEELGFTDAWYRDEIIFLETEDFSEFVKLADDQSLSKVDIILSKFHESGQPWGDQNVGGWLRVRQDIYRNDDNSYRCGNVERVSFEENSVLYELSNIVPTVSFATIEECSNDNLENPYERSYSYRFTEGNSTYSTDFYFREQNAEFTALPDWINIKDKSDMLAATEIISHMSSFAIGWDQDVLVDTDYWRKRLEYDNIIIDKDNQNNWVKSIKQEDNTILFECSVDGVVWVTCEG